MSPPIDPGPCRWDLPEVSDGVVTNSVVGPVGGLVGDLVGLGADLEPATLLAAYRRGLFPMRVERGGAIGWWSPDPRGVFSLGRDDGVHVSRSLRRSCRRFDIRVDTAFADVIRECADPTRPNGWIDDEFVAAYTRLHEMGWAHSLEAWTKPVSGRSQLAGGLYGVAIGGLFAAESKFHRVTDASKVAVVACFERLRAGGGMLFDVQWRTDHLATLGAVDVPRAEYRAQVESAVRAPQLTLD